MAQAQNFVVQEISEDGPSAVLLDQDTGTEHTVVVGDEIEGWEVTAIDASGVSIMKEPEGDMPYGIVHKLEKMLKLKFTSRTRNKSRDFSAFKITT